MMETFRSLVVLLIIVQYCLAAYFWIGDIRLRTSAGYNTLCKKQCFKSRKEFLFVLIPVFPYMYYGFLLAQLMVKDVTDWWKELK